MPFAGFGRTVAQTVTRVAVLLILRGVPSSHPWQLIGPRRHTHRSDVDLLRNVASYVADSEEASTPEPSGADVAVDVAAAKRGQSTVSHDIAADD